MSKLTPAIDPLEFRRVLGAYPTGVCVITSRYQDSRIGMAVGSFTSISLEPPLVGFFPGKQSSSWRDIALAGRFCVNVLGRQQTDICRRFAAKSDNKFGDLSHGHSPAGLPLIDGAVAWLDCVVESVFDIGDHHLVVGAVEGLDCSDEGSPLIFLRGGYHQLSESSAA